MIPRSKARTRMRVVLDCMYLLRRSLGGNGCGVKRVSPFLACIYILYGAIV
jgi:hypothetical protein